MSIDCEFGTLGVTDMADGIVIRVFADTDRTDCTLADQQRGGEWQQYGSAAHAERFDRW